MKMNLRKIEKKLRKTIVKESVKCTKDFYDMLYEALYLRTTLSTEEIDKYLNENNYTTDINCKIKKDFTIKIKIKLNLLNKKYLIKLELDCADWLYYLVLHGYKGLTNYLLFLITDCGIVIELINQ